MIVPLFALANAGIAINGDFLARAFTSPITLGILIGYVVGKPVGIVGTSWLVTRLSRGRLRPPVGWAAVAGGGTIAGIGFTVSLLIATLAFTARSSRRRSSASSPRRSCASVLTWVVFRVDGPAPDAAADPRRCSARSETIVDLAAPVDPERDHIRGPEDAPVTLVEYGDFECPYCGQAEPVVRELLARLRRRPLRLAAPAAQRRSPARAAGGRGGRGRAAQGAFWEMHDLLLEHQDALRIPRPDRLRRASSGSTSSGSRTTCAGTRPRPASPRTSTAPT